MSTESHPHCGPTGPEHQHAHDNIDRIHRHLLDTLARIYAQSASLTDRVKKLEFLQRQITKQFMTYELLVTPANPYEIDLGGAPPDGNPSDN